MQDAPSSEPHYALLQVALCPVLTLELKAFFGVFRLALGVLVRRSTRALGCPTLVYINGAPCATQVGASYMILWVAELVTNEKLFLSQAWDGSGRACTSKVPSSVLGSLAQSAKPC